MRKLTLVDTGPWFALLNRRDRFHRWAWDQFEATPPPLFTCEAVVSETWFLAGHLPHARDAVVDFLERQAIKVGFQLDAEIDAVATLMKRYRNLPMSLADACLVRMLEMNPGSVLLTLDSDFRIYRMNRRRVIPVRMPREV